MKREIKFRAWSKVTDKMIYEGNSPCYQNWEVLQCGADTTGNYIVMQYTGLKDKNGKEIYEGDVVHLGGDGCLSTDGPGNWWAAAGPAGYSSPLQEVKWDGEIAGFFPFANYDSDCGVFMYADRCEVLGNIYENPELLNNGKERRTSAKTKG